MQSLDLERLSLEKGVEAPAGERISSEILSSRDIFEYAPTREGRLIRPAADGEILLSITGPRGGLGGLDWTRETDWLTVELTADTDRMARMHVEFVDQSTGRLLDIYYQMIPTCRVKLTFQLAELSSRRYFLPTYPGAYKGHVYGEPTSITQIDTLRIRLAPGGNTLSLHLHSVTLTREQPDLRVVGSPMVDALGQRKGFDWQDKMGGEAELIPYLRGELVRAQEGSQYPEGWSRYGGWKAVRFEGTGFFRTRHDGKRWLLVDPDGYAFFSNGVCYASRMGVYGFTDRMEPLFDWLPDRNDPTYAACWTTADQIPEFAKRNGMEAGKHRPMFNFARANMIRAFGKDGWWDAWVTINVARLKRWGFNTIGVGVNNYGDERVQDFLEKARMPFVWTLKKFPLTRKTIYRDFPDVFSPEYAEGSARFAREQLAPFVGNPLMIGYFITNEPEWLFQDSVNPAERVLAYDGPLHSKDAMIAFLRERYGDDIGRLNAAWDMSLATFDELKKPITRADERTAASRADLEAFRDILIRKYSAVPSEALRKVDPDHLNLGMRYNRLTPNELAGNESFDICSFNCYRPSPAPMFDIVRDRDKRPGLVGEWHIAGDDARNPATGLWYAHGQADRAKACVYYMEQAFAHPAAVGIHYFEMNDQPVLGRFDGECMQHGLISLCNKPYAALTGALEQVAGRMYPLVFGEIPPTEETAPIETVLTY